ncbi:MAG: alanine racemase [Oscillospiraceae bacterium]
MDRKFPRIVIDRDKLRNNCTQIVRHCEARGIAVAGVIKGAGGLPEIARLYRSCGAAQLATSRLEQMELWRREGIPGPYMLLRVPGLSELPEVARLADYSLQSDATTLDALNSVCAEQGVTHRVIVMADLGDLREGFWDKTEMVEVCCHVEQGLDHPHLAGVGVNLGCYGAVKPTPENMGQLVDIARAVEARIGRRLEIVPWRRHQQLHPGPLGYHAPGHQPSAHRRDGLTGQGPAGGLGHQRHGLPAPGTMRLEAEIIELRKSPPILWERRS